jgi:hypothetical protein
MLLMKLLWALFLSSTTVFSDRSGVILICEVIKNGQFPFF